MVTRPRAAMVLEMGEGGAERAGGARGAAIVELRATLADVRHFAAHRAAYDRGEGRPQALSRIDLEALIPVAEGRMRSEEHTSELQSLMRISYAVFCLKQKKT